MPAQRLNQSVSRQTLAFFLRQLVGDTTFTIISNNCWGAHIYQALGIPYYTPFVGLFIPPESYLQLLRRFDDCIRHELSFASESRSASLNVWREREKLTYPIGLLGSHVELHFLHYANENDAHLKWNRRCPRISAEPKRRFFKFDDREGATVQDIHEFCKLPFANKVCFTAASYDGSTIVVPGEPGDMHVLDGQTLSRISRRHFNALRWISRRPSWIPIPSLL
jgi:uncharacterized protein (DUF1919 family)